MLDIQNLECGYGRLESVLRGLSFSLHPGEILGVLGRNGVGKSTLVKALNGVLPMRHGTIAVDGVSVGRESTRKRLSRGLVAVPEGRQIFGTLTVEENLAVAAGAAGRRATNERLDRATEGLPDLRTRYSQVAGGLSGGQQQMLAVARGLVTEPRYLLVDEPSLGLAPRVINDVGDMLKRAAAQGVGVLLVEQNVGLVESLCERALVLSSNQGHELVDLTTASVADVVRRAYIDT